MPKPVLMTRHAVDQMIRRGAEEPEVVRAVREGAWESARRGKWHASVRIPFRRPSPVNGRVYAWKVVDAVFADEPEEIAVVTVKV
jgi:hypothetical protein